MNNKTIELLEFNKIKEILKSYAISQLGKNYVNNLEPYVDKNVIEKNLNETSEARNIVNITSSIPIHSLNGIDTVLGKLERGLVLSPEDLSIISGLLKDTTKLKRFMKDKEMVAPNISNYAISIYELVDLKEEIDNCIVYGRVDDRASNKLLKVRKKIKILEDRIKVKLDNFLKSNKNKSILQDSVVSMRNGRYVIPIKSEYKRDIDGEIQDRSSSGSTVFIEPAEVKKIQNELNICRAEEENEVFIVLSNLTNLIVSYEREIKINIETMAYYDFLFAKGKYSKNIDGNKVNVNDKNYVNIINGKHPLIGKKAVPLNFIIGKDYRAVIITGPNTGGKTVALKTVGLLTMMVQSGLHIPADTNSEIGIFADILVDIGDGQSIEQSLSTFSSHITNVIDILKCADKNTLVIVDEIGSGTDPSEGMGLAVSILERLYNNGATILATTHYSEIKEFAKNTKGFINGSMEFDIETLKPLYKLNIGIAGESNAFLIALRLGMNKEIIERAHQVTYKENKDYSNYKWDSINTKKVNENIEDIHKKQLEKLKDVNKKNNISEKQKKKPKFKIGDNVYISFMDRTGIICELENSKGEYGVMVMKKKIKINQKRLSLYISSDELYPEDYDYDIVFESKENRKKKHDMNRKHVEGVSITKENN